MRRRLFPLTAIQLVFGQPEAANCCGCLHIQAPARPHSTRKVICSPPQVAMGASRFGVSAPALEALVRRRYLLADAHGDPGARVPRDFNPHVSEGGLDPRPWWYIPKRGIYHQPKVTRKGPPGPAIRRRKDAAAPARPGRSRRVNCGNDGGGQPDWSRGPGPDCGSRLPALDHQGSTVTASRCCPAVPAPQPQPRKPAQMTVPPS